jgi:3-oxoacyl-[acyl-carrier-protein] synthase III
VQVSSKILLPAFGAGLTWNSHLVQWGDRITPLATSDIELPPCDETALELIAPYLTQQRGQLRFQTESLQQAEVV